MIDHAIIKKLINKNKPVSNRFAVSKTIVNENFVSVEKATFIKRILEEKSEHDFLTAGTTKKNFNNPNTIKKLTDLIQPKKTNA